MPSTIEELFATYCKFVEPDERARYAFSTPRLLFDKTVLALSEQIPRSDDDDGPWERLRELDYIRTQLVANRSEYPIGPGPIEQLVATTLRPNEIIARCRSAELQALISPRYLRALAYHAEDNARTASWESAALLSRYVTEAALAWEPALPIEHDIGEVVLAHLRTAFNALLIELDDTVFCQTIALATVMVERAERLGDRKTLGKLCQMIGSLFSDIWTVPGPPNDPTPVPIEEWLKRPLRSTGIFTGLGEPCHVPNVAESLDMAVAWYRRALACRTGLHRGLTYKAIAQTLHFQNRFLHRAIDQRLLERCLALAPELLEKHRDASAHLRTLNSIAEDRRLKIDVPLGGISADDRLIIEAIEASSEPVEERYHSHGEALRDLQRALRYDLPFALYLRNFDYANERRMIGDTFKYRSENTTHFVAPEITYSLVDHKILQLFEEGTIAICDPRIDVYQRETLIPMLSLRDSGWLEAVRRLILRCARVVMVLDETTPGVRSELDLLRSAGAAQRTLIVTGHSFRASTIPVPRYVVRHFPYIVDWIDFAWDESYHSYQHKAHVLMRPYLSQYVRSNAKPTVDKWLKR